MFFNSFHFGPGGLKVRCSQSRSILYFSGPSVPKSLTFWSLWFWYKYGTQIGPDRLLRRSSPARYMQLPGRGHATTAGLRRDFDAALRASSADFVFAGAVSSLEVLRRRTSTAAALGQLGFFLAGSGKRSPTPVLCGPRTALTFLFGWARATSQRLTPSSVQQVLLHAVHTTKPAHLFFIQRTVNPCCVVQLKLP